MDDDNGKKRSSSITYIADECSNSIYKRHNHKLLFNLRKRSPFFENNNKKIKTRKHSKFKLFKISVLLLFLIMILSVVKFLQMAYPTFKASCENAALSIGNKIISEVVRNVMEDYTYENLVNIEKDTNGNITFIHTNSIMINNIVSNIIFDIQGEFDKIPRIEVPINLGTVSGISFLSRFDPKFNAKLESSGKIYSDVRTELKAVGINQSEHKIYINLNGVVSVLTPINSFSKEISEEVLLVEAIIVGQVPETYYNLTGVDSADDTYNFVQ